MTSQTLTETLRSLGYTHRRTSISATSRAHDVVSVATGRVVFTGSATAAWAWLHKSGLA